MQNCDGEKPCRSIAVNRSDKWTFKLGVPLMRWSENISHVPSRLLLCKPLIPLSISPTVMVCWASHLPPHEQSTEHILFNCAFIDEQSSTVLDTELYKSLYLRANKSLIPLKPVILSTLLGIIFLDPLTFFTWSQCYTSEFAYTNIRITAYPAVE